MIDVISDNNWGFRGSGRGRPRGEFGGNDGVDRRNVSEMVTALHLSCLLLSSLLQ